jgi:pilus assembly protein CpaB
MRRYRPFLLLGLAGIIAFSTSSMVYRWLRAQSFNSQPVVEAPSNTVRVAAANFDIPRGSTLTAEMLKTVQLPEDSVPLGVFKAEEVGGLVGRVALYDVMQNEAVLQSKLAPVDATGGVAALLDPEKRAMSVHVDEEVGVAGFVKPTDRVDLFVTVDVEGKNGEPGDTITKLVLANTLVLATGTELVRNAKDEVATPVKVITLEVTPEEGEKLALASTKGKFRLALRSPLSKEIALTRGATVDTLLNSYQGAKPHPDAEGEKVQSQTIQLIKGKTVSIVAF